MKKEIITIILLSVCLITSGQTISQSNNRYRGSDVLEKKQIVVKGFGLNDTKGVWSLEEAEISEESYDAEYTTEADTMMAVEQGNRTYYSQDRGSISIIGSENFMELISYDMPETWLTFPMQMGDSVCGYFNGSGPYCERFFLRRYGTYKTKADAAGKIVLPQGDTLRNVLRLHTERYVGTIAVPIDTMLCRIPAFTVDSIIQHLAPDTAKVREDVYRWYAEGYRYPILEAQTLSYRDSMLTEEMYYCPPEMQEQLSLDEENKQTRARLIEEELARWQTPSPSPDEPTNRHGNDHFRYDITQPDGSDQVTIHYNTDHDTRVTALISNGLGYVYRRADETCPAGSGRLSLSSSGLRKGQYIIYIHADGNQYAEKVNVK